MKKKKPENKISKISVQKELAIKSTSTYKDLELNYILLFNELSSIKNSKGWKIITFLRNNQIIKLTWKAAKFPSKISRYLFWKAKSLAYYIITISKKRKPRILNLKSKKIAYIGYSCHLKTKSTTFLVALLRKYFKVKTVSDFSWKGGRSPDLSFLDNSYFAAIFFQNPPSIEMLKKIRCKNLILFPMFDHAGWQTLVKIPEYRNLKIINFANATHILFKKWGFDSMRIQYFPKPDKFTPGDKKRIYFWQRITSLNINTVAKLIGDQEMKIHLHTAVDYLNEYIKPTKLTEKKYSIKYSDWIPSKNESDEIIGQSAIYISPRPLEGIGMSFLDAMAMGKAVVGANNPTMNEYIKDKKTGYLFNPENPKQIDFTDVEKIQKNVMLYMQDGYKKWESEKTKIIDFIKQP